MMDIIIETAYGRLKGITQDGIHSFKGIPYGGPTGGLNRFMPPKPPDSWSGIKEVKRYGPSCWQALEGYTSTKLLGPVGIDSMSEDCLVLNIWTPGINDSGKRPVMVWMHGGGFFLGSGDHIPYYEGLLLAKSGNVVVVSINHRLGVFGYLYLEEIAGERYAGSGNAGMLDLIAALEWIRENIERFGGDPKNVTIFGESGGGAKVSLLLGMPKAKGLFHRAIIQSGPGLRALAPEDGTRIAYEFLKVTDLNRDNIGQLQQMRGDMIYSAWMAAANKAAIPGMPRGGEFAPVVDGKIIPNHPFDPVAAPTASDVPLLIGTNKDEMTFMLMRDPLFGKYDHDTMRQRILAALASKKTDNMQKEGIESLLKTYSRTRPGATPHDILIAINSDRMRVGSIRLAERKVSGGPAPVFMYLFTWESPALNGMLKSCHTLEIPFVFNNMEPIGILGDSPERFSLAKRMSAAWVEFARKGDPNHEGIPLWQPYSPSKRSTMIFNTFCREEVDPNGEERKAWEGIL